VCVCVCVCVCEPSTRRHDQSAKTTCRNLRANCHSGMLDGDRVALFSLFHLLSIVCEYVCMGVDEHHHLNGRKRERERERQRESNTLFSDSLASSYSPGEGIRRTGKKAGRQACRLATKFQGNSRTPNPQRIHVKKGHCFFSPLGGRGEGRSCTKDRCKVRSGSWNLRLLPFPSVSMNIDCSFFSLLCHPSLPSPSLWRIGRKEERTFLHGQTLLYPSLCHSRVRTNE